MKWGELVSKERRSGSESPLILVEDNPDDLHLIRDALHDCGITVCTTCTDGEQALEHFDELEDHRIPGLILIDIKLPGIDGFEVLQRVRSSEKLRKIPVVIFTASSDTADIERAMSLGANSYVIKPSNREEFKRAVVDLCHYWLHMNVRFRS